LGYLLSFFLTWDKEINNMLSPLILLLPFHFFIFSIGFLFIAF
jgi:hypothetical protein